MWNRDNEIHLGDEDDPFRAFDPVRQQFERMQRDLDASLAEDQQRPWSEIVQAENSYVDRFMIERRTNRSNGATEKGPALTPDQEHQIRQIEELYQQKRSIHEVFDFMHTLHALDDNNPKAEKRLAILDAFVDFLALHDAPYQKELHEAKLAAEKARLLAPMPDPTQQWTERDDAMVKLAIEAATLPPPTGEPHFFTGDPPQWIQSNEPLPRPKPHDQRRNHRKGEGKHEK